MKIVHQNILEAAKKSNTRYLILTHEKGKIGIKEVNCIDEHENAPLYYAVLHQNHEVAKILLSYGARPNTRNTNGNTALHVAFKNDDERVYNNNNNNIYIYIYIDGICSNVKRS